MSKLCKPFALFFSVLMLVIGISPDSFTLSDNTALISETGSPGKFYLVNPDHNIINLKLPEDKPATLLQESPEPNFRKQPSDFIRNCLIPGIKDFVTSSKNISFSSSLVRNLPISIIIFPFHYFW